MASLSNHFRIVAVFQRVKKRPTAECTQEPISFFLSLFLPSSNSLPLDVRSCAHLPSLSLAPFSIPDNARWDLCKHGLFIVLVCISCGTRRRTEERNRRVAMIRRIDARLILAPFSYFHSIRLSSSRCTFEASFLFPTEK